MNLPSMPQHPSPAERAERALQRLARGPHPALDAAALARIEARLLAAIPATTAHRSPAWRWRAVALRALAACAVLILAVAAVWGLANRSLPGQPLYPVRQGTEALRMHLAGDPQAATLHLRYADRRLDEFEALLDRGELHLTTLDRAAAELSAALALLEDHRAAPDTAPRLFALSVRQTALAERAAAIAIDHDEALPILAASIAQATQIGVQTRALAGDLLLAAVPADRLSGETGALSLAPDSAVLLPRAPQVSG